MDILNGHIERITFSSQETPFCVCRLKTKGRKELVTIVGNMVNPLPGEMVELKGKWTTHEKFGDQFQVYQYKTLVPSTAYGIEKYLGSGLVKGIGPVMAKRIIKKFGTQSLEIIENQGHRLAEVEGIGEKRIQMILTAWDEQKEVRAVMLFLQSHGVSTAYAAKIFKTYGQDAISIVKDNPYQLARDIFGIGFLTADNIAKNLGISPDSSQRIEAGVEFALLKLSDEGHVCYPKNDLIPHVQQLIDIDTDLIKKAVQRLWEQGRIIIETTDENQGDVSQKIVFLKKYHTCEIGILSNFNRILITEKSIRPIDSERALFWVQDRIPFKLADNQKKAVRAAIDEKILIITGGPGTGKTTIINSILKIFKKAGAKILLAAPTGRAAKRMSETSREKASTIHRLLDYSIQQGGFKKKSSNPLVADVLIIDEASMIDTVLMHHLLKAVPSSCTLICVGDIHQLPSVGPGNVLGDLISSETFKVVTLDEIFRQAQKSLIVVNAHKINNGEFPIIINENKKSNFYFIQKDDPEEVLNTVKDLVLNRVPKRFNLDPLNDIQVLTPMHRGIVGASNLNIELQQCLNPSDVSISRGNREYRLNDKVMQIRNNYDKHTYNGDIGRIQQINHADQTVEIDFDGRPVTYTFGGLEELVHAFAVSVHKSQGSEYPAVIIPIVTQHYILLQRNLIYTAVTRGKKLVILVGTKKALGMGIRTVKSINRCTMLASRLAKMMK